MKQYKPRTIKEINEAISIFKDTCEYCHDCAVCPLELDCTTMFNVIPRAWSVFDVPEYNQTVDNNKMTNHIMERFTKVE